MAGLSDSPAGAGEVVGPMAAAGAAPHSFWLLLPRAILYPARGDGPWLVFGGGLGMCLAGVASMFAPLAGFIIQVVLVAYFAMFALRNIAASAGGDQEPPGWPDITSLDDTVAPLLLVLGSCLLCLAPFLGYLVYLETGVRTVNTHLYVALLASGLAYLPMGLLAVALRDSVSGLSPLVVLPAIVKVLPAYLVALAAIGAACALFYPLGYVTRIPLLGSLLGAMLYVYWLTLVTHIIGLIYRGYARRLNWFPEE